MKFSLGPFLLSFPDFELCFIAHLCNMSHGQQQQQEIAEMSNSKGKSDEEGKESVRREGIIIKIKQKNVARKLL